MDVSAEFARAVIDGAADGDVTLKLWRVFQAGDTVWATPWYGFSILVGGAPAGGIRLRVGDTDLLRLWAGHIGFNVEPGFRGRRVAERATRLILPLVAAHGITFVWLTCDPGNIASEVTLARLGARFVETVVVPPQYAAFEPAATRKQRYRLDLPRGGADRRRRTRPIS